MAPSVGDEDQDDDNDDRKSGACFSTVTFLLAPSSYLVFHNLLIFIVFILQSLHL